MAETYAGVVPEEMQPVGIIHVGIVLERLSPMGGITKWSGGGV